jgi:hypothetical protein
MCYLDSLGLVALVAYAAVADVGRDRADPQNLRLRILHRRIAPGMELPQANPGRAREPLPQRVPEPLAMTTRYEPRSEPGKRQL